MHLRVRQKGRRIHQQVYSVDGTEKYPHWVVLIIFVSRPNLRYCYQYGNKLTAQLIVLKFPKREHGMRLLGKDTIYDLLKQDSATSKWLTIWVNEVAYAQWQCASDVLIQFPNAQERNCGLFIFETEPKGFCIEVQVAFPQRVAVITGFARQEEDNNGQN